MALHSKNKHSNQGKTKPKMLKDVDHTCVICDRTVKHMKQSLTRHLTVHNLTVEGYYRDYIAKSLERGDTVGSV